MLKDINDNLIASAKSVKDISDEEIGCLQAFADCPEMVDWIRTDVPRKAIQCTL